MGIQGLTKLISDNAPKAIVENDRKSYFSRKVAVDASMALYQFMIAIRQGGDQLTSGNVNEDGETTSHLVGMFYRTISMLEKGIKPVYVFDGKPPELKSGEITKRRERREEAEEALKKAEEAENMEEIRKYKSRLVRVTNEQKDDAIQLLRLMGVPIIEAPSEAEAQCAAMCKAGLVYGTVTEDVDALTFGTTILLRHMTASEARKLPVMEISLSAVLEGLDLTMDQFIDLCILCGCDYTGSIRGIGPKTALNLIRQHKTIEGVMEAVKDRKGAVVPADFNFQGARQLFKQPEVLPSEQINLVWKPPDEEGLKAFLLAKGFGDGRIDGALKRLKKKPANANQGRLTDFFKRQPSPAGPTSGAKKRKSDGSAGAGSKAKKLKKR